MSRELSSSILTATAQTVTSPGYLVRIELPSQTLRLSSRGDITWNGELYVARGMSVEVDEDAEAGEVSASVTIADADRAYTAILLTDGVADRPMSIWKFYGDGPLGRFDVIPRASGVGDSASFNINDATVSIAMTQAGAATQFSPRRYITKQEGYSLLPPAGTIIVFAGEQFALEGQ